jgi:flagellar biosynthesis protein FlhB
MADDSTEARTEEPTPRRLERARRSGLCATSRGLVAGSAVASVCVVMVVTGKAWVGGLALHMHSALAGAASGIPFSTAVREGLRASLWALGLPLGVAFAIPILVGLAQTRGNIAIASVRTDVRRIAPSLGRILGRDRAIDAASDVIKVAILCGVAYASLRPRLSVMAALSGASAGKVLGTLGALAGRLGMHLAIAMVGLGFADYLWQVVRHQSRLRMTRDEARHEHREDEGDPEARAERRRIHREVLVEGALRDVRTAALVLVDPRGCSVAIHYDEKLAGGAPVLAVRSERPCTRDLEDAARAAGVPIVVEPTLVAALARVDEGDEIPETIYVPVAELMARGGKMVGR